MAEDGSAPTISLRERTFPSIGAEDRLPKWLTLSLLGHGVLIVCMFLVPLLPSTNPPAPPVYTVDLIGGEKIGRTNLGTELAPVNRSPAESKEETFKPEIKKEKIEKAKVVEKKTPPEERLALNEKKTKETIKPETKERKKNEEKTETASADSVRERLIQSAAERAKSRTESSQKASKGTALSTGAGEGDGAAALGPGGRGGPGVVKGMDFIIYQNRMMSTIKENWAWVGQRSNLAVVVHFAIKDNGEIVGLKVVQPSGDQSYDESVLRALKKSSPLPAPPDAYRKDFADVEITFRPRDLGA
jgi:colicin import membrane protein